LTARYFYAKERISMPRRNRRIAYEIPEISLEMLAEKASYGLKPECADCPLSAHGFICSSSDGSCLRNGYKKAPERDGDNAGS
jgi:hypothetical protein